MRQFRFDYNLGEANESQTILVNFLEADLAQATQVFFRLRFRDKSHYWTFADNDIYPHKAHTLRLLELTVFRGNHIKSTVLTDPNQSVITKAYLSSGNEVLLADTRSPGPYVRFSLDPNLSVTQALKLENLGFDLNRAERLQPSSIGNCLHSLDDSTCLVCDYKYIRSLGVCQPCDPVSMFDHSTETCVDTQIESLTSVLDNIPFSRKLLK